MTLCGWCTRQTISLSVLAWNPNKGFELDIYGENGSGGGKEGPREDRGIWKGTKGEAVDNAGQRRAIRGEGRTDKEMRKKEATKEWIRGKKRQREWKERERLLG